jgi:hypothetical protein
LKYISHARSNVKGGVDCALFPKTLIVGRRGTGKSAVVNSVELSLDGCASDIAGRDVASLETELLALAPPGEDLRAAVNFSEELVGGAVAPVGAADCRVGRSDAGAKKKVRHAPSNVDGETLVLRGVTQALLGNPDTARKFLLRHAGAKTVTAADVEAQIPVPLRDYYRRALVTCPPGAATDGLLGVLEVARKAERDATKRAKASSAVLEAAGQNVAACPPVTQVAAAALTLATARAALETATRAEATCAALATQRAALEEQLAVSTARLAAADELRQRIVAEVRALPPEAAHGPPPTLLALLAALEVNHTSSPTECLCCGAPTTPESVQARIDAIAAATSRSAECSARYRALTVQHDSVMAEWQHAMELQTHAKAALNDLRGTTNDPRGAVDATPGDIDALRAAVATAEAQHTSLQRAAAAWETLECARDEQHAAEVEAAAWKALSVACGDTVRQLVDVHVDGFVARVQQRLPPRWKFVLQLRDGERETFRLGLECDGHLRTALCGGEWAAVTAAVADACVPQETDLSVLIPGDHGVDPESLTEVLEAFGRCRSQVIVTSAVAPTVVPVGWHVIDTDRGEHRAPAASAACDTATAAATAASAATAGKKRRPRKVA